MRHTHVFSVDTRLPSLGLDQLGTLRRFAFFLHLSTCPRGDCRANRLLPDEQKAYLITSLHILIRQLPAPVPPGLLAAHIRLLASHHASLGSGLLPGKADSPEKILRTARKHTTKAPTSAAVWLARLSAERQFATQNEINAAWEEARKHVTGDRIQDVWLWGLEPANRRPPSPDCAPGTASERDLADIEAEVEVLEVSLQAYATDGRTDRDWCGPRAFALHSNCFTRARLSGSRRRRAHCMRRS